MSLKSLLWALACALPLGLPAQGADPLLDGAREAWRKRDGAALNRLSERAIAQSHPLAPWVDYWRLASQLASAKAEDVETFYQRWPGSYQEDRLRNDWLLELGRRQDWTGFAADYPRFRMDDDREVHCHALSAEQALGRPLKGPQSSPLAERALQAWLAQREADEGCLAMAKRLAEARLLGREAVLLKLERSAEAGRAKAFEQALELLPRAEAKALSQAYEQPQRLLRRRARPSQEELALALLRLAQGNADGAAEVAERMEPRGTQLNAARRQWLWAQLARLAALRQQPGAHALLQRALAARSATQDWSEDSQAWAARIALRAGDWPLLGRLIAAMPEALRQDAGWRYWQAQARYRSAADGAAGDPQRHAARGELLRLAHPLHFYGQLAAEELGQRLALPGAPPALTAAEREQAAAHPGLNRALLLIQLGLRSEGVREWNFSLRGMDDRQLLAAAERACAAQIWDRCINTSEKTVAQIDLAQRYPMPYREQVLERARAAGLDPADPYGLMRQESRFIQDARSAVGAGGLMQVMPTTARWTARKLGLAYSPQRLHELDFNLRVGMGYLRLVLDDFGGALPLAAAAYNAGPGRPRRWREGEELDAAVWAECIPFNETRDYVKKVLANATVYARLLGRDEAGLRERLGLRIGPRASAAPAINPDLP